MKKIAFIFAITTLLITSSCVKDGYKTLDSVKYKIVFETQDESESPGGTMTIYSNTFDSTMVKDISGSVYQNGYSWDDLVGWDDESGVKINPDANTKAHLTITFRGDVLTDTKKGYGQEVKFIKTYQKSEFKE